MINKSATLIFAGVLTGLATGPTAAQNVARVQAVERLVKAGSSATSLVSVTVGHALNAGDRVRTGGRSSAGLRFPDASTVHLGELTEVVVTSAQRRDTQLLRGKLLADYKKPGTVSGGSAVAAVRGTHVEYELGPDAASAVVRCYSGRVFVASHQNPLAAGTVDRMSETNLEDAGLVGSTVDWRGGEIRLVDGPLRGQSRPIRAFDPQRGLVTFSSPIPGAGVGPHGYLLVRDPRRGVVELLDNTATEVKPNQDPSKPFGVPHEKFARFSRASYPQRLQDNRHLYVLPGTLYHQRLREDEWPIRDLIYDFTRHDRQACDLIQVPDPQLRSSSFFARSATLGTGPASTSQGAVTRDAAAIPSNVLLPATVEGRYGQFLFEPFALGGTNGQDAVGSRLRVKASNGDVYGEFGYRYKLLNGESFHDLSEAFINVRGKHGDLVVGRQHLFLGASHNTDLGTLLGLETSDAAVYQLPLKNGWYQQIGYLWDSHPLVRQADGFSAFYARGQAPLWGGYLGYALLGATDDERKVGWSIDGAQPVMKNVLDAYAELGQDTFGRDIFSGGFYVPALYHKYRLDLFVEYARREGLDERFTVRFRREFGNGLLAIGYVDKQLGGGDTNAGGGLFWSRKFQ